MRTTIVQLSSWELDVLLRGIDDIRAPEGRVDLALDIVALRRKLRSALYGRYPSKPEPK